MHLLIPFAACLDPASQATWATLKLPHLNQLLARLTAPNATATALAATETSLSTPHERALAAARGLQAPDGLLPWGAAYASAIGLMQHTGAVSAPAWAVITPVNWSVQTAHITMTDPAELLLDETDSKALLAAMAPYFEQDGVTLHYDKPGRWLACGEVFRNLPTAAIDRVIGRNVQDWQPITAGAHAAQAKMLRRLQAEMQMLLYTHPISDQRSARGLPPVNSFWVSGTGDLGSDQSEPASATTEPAGLTVETTLRAPAIAEDWVAWGRAWEALDAHACAALLTDIKNQGSGPAQHQLTLCGERDAITWVNKPLGAWDRLRRLNTDKFGEMLRKRLHNML